MASAMASIANDGVLAPPRVVLGTYDPDGIFHERGRPAPKRVLSSNAERQIGAMLEGVVENGTGKRASVPGYRIAGKSDPALHYYSEVLNINPYDAGVHKAMTGLHVAGSNYDRAIQTMRSVCLIDSKNA